MQIAYISIGGNIDPKLHIQNALIQFKKHFLNVQFSSIYQSKAVGFQGDDFLNLVIRLETNLTVGQLNDFLHDMEDNEGRKRLNGKSWDSRTLDLDILLYGDFIGEVDGVKLPRAEILEHAHVLLPLAELTHQTIHPLTGKTYQKLVKESDFSDQKIWQIQL